MSNPLKDVQSDLLNTALVKDIDLKGRRVVNAGNSQNNQDYVTQKQLQNIGVGVGLGGSGKIETAISPAARIEFTPAGINVYNAANTLVLTIDLTGNITLLSLTFNAQVVSKGVANSGGAGFSLLRVPN